MIKKTVNILKKQWLSPNVFILECLCERIKPEPGQFLQVQINDTFDPILNRPISIAGYNSGRLLLIIKVVGRGTEILSKKNPGERLTIFGPLGKKIRIQRKKSLIIAGGIGIAPLYFLAQKLRAQGIDFTFIYGARTPEELVLKDNLKKIASRAIFITETGRRKKGTALSALAELDIGDYEIGYACGPKAMLRELQSMELRIPVYAFCEDFLGCGCGLCLGCAIKYYGKYKRICEDGPVFALKGIEFD
jgi:dihydroorotate dehydrogenase electron transfer subunit